MFKRSNTRTTFSDPIRVDSVTYPRGEGEVGLTICPGMTRLAGEEGSWDRNLVIDLADLVGRGAMVACRLLIEAGLPPEEALTRVREARPGAVEAAEQVRYVESLRALAMSRD